MNDTLMNDTLMNDTLMNNTVYSAGLSSNISFFGVNDSDVYDVGIEGNTTCKQKCCDDDSLTTREMFIIFGVVVLVVLFIIYQIVDFFELTKKSFSGCCCIKEETADDVMDRTFQDMFEMSQFNKKKDFLDFNKRNVVMSINNIEAKNDEV